ncbi:MAG: hypothetical protein ACK53Y_02395, partial [bacterium]
MEHDDLSPHLFDGLLRLCRRGKRSGEHQCEDERSSRAQHVGRVTAWVFASQFETSLLSVNQPKFTGRKRIGGTKPREESRA